MAKQRHLVLGAMCFACSACAAAQPVLEVSSEIETNGKLQVIEMAQVPGGCFKMGGVSDDAADDEKPVHKVCVDGFLIGKTEVTQGLWKAVMGSNPSVFKMGDDYPVETVNWNEVQSFVGQLNNMTGKDYRLPTEAEWEYAARSGGKKEKYLGSRADAVAWYKDNSGGATHPVAQKNPNDLGIHDMLGNVWEWCQDWYGEGYYASSPPVNPGGPLFGSQKVDRGGSWDNGTEHVRAANRDRAEPDAADGNLGFRLVLPKIK